MNIKRSRVNMITTGFTYGSSFSKKMDVEGCCMTLAYETLNYSTTFGLSIEKTSLWEIISKKESWNEDQYEEYLFKAKEELTEICTAIFEHPKFNEIVIDVSGGFDSRIVFAVASTPQCNLRFIELLVSFFTSATRSFTSAGATVHSSLSSSLPT